MCWMHKSSSSSWRAWAPCGSSCGPVAFQTTWSSRKPREWFGEDFTTSKYLMCSKYLRITYHPIWTVEWYYISDVKWANLIHTTVKFGWGAKLPQRWSKTWRHSWEFGRTLTCTGTACRETQGEPELPNPSRELFRELQKSCASLAGLRCATRWLPNGRREQFLLRHVVTELRKSQEPRHFDTVAVIASCFLTKDM